MAMKKTTPPKSGIMKYAPVTTKKKAATGSTTSVASKGAATVKKQPITSKQPVPAKKLTAKTTTPATTTKKPVTKITNLPAVTVTAKRTTTTTKPATTAATSKKPLYTGNPNVTYVTKDKNNKNIEVSYDEYRKIKGPKTEIRNDADGYPIIQGSGGARYRDYTPLKGKKLPKDIFAPGKNK